jgi:demethylmenaquinone methyltransferase/2-methoxy-6-polyprenyl-1,4-benzoquinol methylase
MSKSSEKMRDRNLNTKIASYWSKWALVWDPMLRLARLDQKYRKDAISVLSLKKGQTVLDVACGTGLNFPYLLNGVGPNGLIIAVDIAPGMLEKAKIRAQNNGFNNIHFILGDVSEIELPKVDAVAACWCMISIPNYHKALENIVESLRPHGKIAILDFKRMNGFPGPIFNPIFEWICRFTHQDVTREPWHDLKRLLGNVQMREWKYGAILSSVYLAWGTKEPKHEMV